MLKLVNVIMNGFGSQYPSQGFIAAHKYANLCTKKIRRAGLNEEMSILY